VNKPTKTSWATNCITDKSKSNVTETCCPHWQCLLMERETASKILVLTQL